MNYRKLTIASSIGVSLGIIVMWYCGLLFRSDWDEAYQMSTEERDLALKVVSSFSTGKAHYVLELPFNDAIVEIFVFRDPRTAVLGVCHMLELDADVKLPFIGSTTNEVRSTESTESFGEAERSTDREVNHLGSVD